MLINQFQRKLYLPRAAGGFADHAKAAAGYDIVGQPEIYDVKHVEELGAEFERSQFGVAAVTEGRVLDQRHIEVVKAGTAEGVAAKGSEAALVRTSASGQIDRNKEEGIVIRAAAEVVLAHGTAG